MAVLRSVSLTACALSLQKCKRVMVSNKGKLISLHPPEEQRRVLMVWTAASNQCSLTPQFCSATTTVISQKEWGGSLRR